MRETGKYLRPDEAYFWKMTQQSFLHNLVEANSSYFSKRFFFLTDNRDSIRLIAQIINSCRHPKTELDTRTQNSSPSKFIPSWEMAKWNRFDMLWLKWYQFRSPFYRYAKLSARAKLLHHKAQLIRDIKQMFRTFPFLCEKTLRRLSPVIEPTLNAICSLLVAL